MALSITGSTYEYQKKLRAGWLHFRNEKISDGAELTMSRVGNNGYGYYHYWEVENSGYLRSNSIGGAVRPVFHLISDARINGGNGEYSNPYILNQ